MSISCIYIIRCLKSIKVYIGSAVDFEKRKYKHIKTLMANKHQDKLQKSFNKHGIHNFTFEILELVEDKAKLIEREQYYLDTLVFAQEYIRKEDDRFQKLAFNLNPTANSQFGFKHSKKTRKEMHFLALGNTNKKGTILCRESINKTQEKIKNIKPEVCDFCKKLYDFRTAKKHGTNCVFNPKHKDYDIRFLNK